MPISQPVGNENNLIITHGFHQELPIPIVSSPIQSKPRDNTSLSTVSYIQIALQLEVVPQRKIRVPGCEPTSALSSNKLSSWLAQSGCGSALVDLDVALEAIPGSYVKLGNNFGVGSMRQKWFVLPALDINCPCRKYEDYYQILRDLAGTEDEETESFDACDLVGMGYCPSPNFDEAVPPPSSPYKEEGEFPAGVGVLPPIPPWGLSGS